MASEEDRLKHNARRQKNKFAKVLFDPNEYRGAYSMKVIQRKDKYKREKLNPHNIEVDQDKEYE